MRLCRSCQGSVGGNKGRKCNRGVQRSFPVDSDLTGTIAWGATGVTNGNRPSKVNLINVSKLIDHNSVQRLNG